MKLTANGQKLLGAGFALSGAAALMYEVVWTRALSLVMGNTVYAVSTMLTAFMAGLALGSYLGGMASDKYKNPLLLFSLCELGIGIFGLLSIFAIDCMPPLYFYVYKNFHLKLEAFFIFQFFLCLPVMLIPTTLMGATFPLVSKARVENFDDLGKDIGSLYSLNTLGSVAGAFAGGFIMIPMLGLATSTIVAGCLNLAVGAAIVLAARRGMGGFFALALLVFLPLAATLGGKDREQGFIYNFYKNGLYDSLTSVAEAADNFELIYFNDDIQGTVKAYKNHETGGLFLENGGKIEGATDVDAYNTLALAYLPVAYAPEAKDFLVIGLGTGITMNAAKNSVGRADCVEINPSVVEAVEEHFFPGLFKFNATLHLADARAFLAATDKKYDIISSEPSYPDSSTAGNLFTVEFFRLAAKRLNENGVFAQWLPYYYLSNDQVTTMVKTYAAAFKHVAVWKVTTSADLIMIGSQRALDDNPRDIAKKVGELYPAADELPLEPSKMPENVEEIVANSAHLPLNTDDRPVIEFAIARRIILGE